MEAVWETYYIYYYDSTKQDNLIKLIKNKMTALLEDKEILKWFFIRYWEGGPHVRVRFLTTKTLDYKEILKDVISFMKDNPFNGILTKENYYSNIKFEGQFTNLDKLPWYQEGEIVKTQYIPEYERYGGEKLMPLTESLFMVSSEFAAHLINLTKDKGLLMRFLFSAVTTRNMVNQLEAQGFLGVTQNVFYENCVNCWRGMYSIEDMTYAKQLLESCRKNSQSISKINDLLLNSNVYNDLTEKLLKGFEEIYREVQAYKAFRSIIFSHLHMLNNRLGIVPEYECALYYSIMEGGVL